MSPGKEAPLEKDIQRSIIKWLKTRPDSFTVKLAAGPYSTPGLPDIMHIERGTAFFFEVKRPGGKVTALQEETMARLNSAGAHVCVVTSLQGVRAIMEEEQMFR